jgi:hypothetical protein
MLPTTFAKATAVKMWKCCQWPIPITNERSGGMKKKIILVLLAVAAGMVAAVVGVHVERIDYVVCDGVLHIEMNQYWGLKKSSWDCPIKDITNVRRSSGRITLLVGDSPYGEIKLGKYSVTKELEKCFLPGYQGERVEVSEYPHRTILPLLLFCIAVIAYREIRVIM